MINHNIFAFTGRGDVITIKTTEYFTEAIIANLRKMESSGNIKILTPDSQMKPSIYNECRFEIADGLLASQFLKVFGDGRLAQVSITQTQTDAAVKAGR